MNDIECIKTKIVVDFKKNAGGWASKFINIDVCETENDATIGRKENLSDSMTFEEGNSSKILSICFFTSFIFLHIIILQNQFHLIFA